MTKLLIKKDDIIKVYINTKQVNKYYKFNYISELKIFNFIIFKEQKYFTYFGEQITNEEIISSNNYIENNIVYRKPYIMFYDKRNNSDTKYFENEEDLFTWLNINFPNYKDFLDL